MNVNGLLPGHRIRDLIATGAIAAAMQIADDQVQPASLDLRLGDCAWRVRASFLPAGLSIAEKLERYALHRIPLENGAVLETGCVYLVQLLERLALPVDISGAANPKSSTGRLDVFTRVIAEAAQGFDTVPWGYRGALHAEICPQTFPVLVRTGSRLSQIRFRRGEAVSSDAHNAALHESQRLVTGTSAGIVGGVALSVDLSGGQGGIVGYRAKRHTGLIDIDREAAYDRGEFWEPIPATPARSLILDPDQFYILASKESVHIPPSHAAEMIPFNPLVGEFRVHYAGFFDPGFGHAAAGGEGSRAVLEVRSHKVPFILEDGQIVGRLIYEPLIEPPFELYGSRLGSHYQAQGLKLSKHFR